MRKLYFLLISVMICSSSLHAQVIVTASGGLQIWNYQNLGRAFTAINNGTHTGVINILLIASTVETATARLNAAGSFTSLRIRPLVVCSVTGNLPEALIDFNGATHVTIDGRISNQDTLRSLTISNRYNNDSLRSSTIQFLNGASNNIIRYCNIEGSARTPLSANILIAETNNTRGNSNNVIDHNDIRPANGQANANAIQARPVSSNTTVTNDNNTFSYNLIHDYSHSVLVTQSCLGIYLSENETSATIIGNSFYQTDTVRIVKGCMEIRSGGTTIIRNNFMGGTAPRAGGSPAIYTGSYPFTGAITAGNSHADARYIIDGNTITNYKLLATIESGSGASFTGISPFYASSVRLENNRIDSISMTYLYTPGTYYTRSFNITALLIGNSGTTTIVNNKIGGFTLDAPIQSDGLICGIRITGYPDTCYVYNNIIQDIRSNVVTGTVNGIEVFGGNAQTNYFHHNKIQNLYMTSTGTKSTVLGLSFQLTYGYYKFNVINTINDNQVTHLYNSGAVKGISLAELVSSPQNAGVYQNNTVIRNALSDFHGGKDVTGIINTSPSFKYMHLDSNNIHALYSDSAATGISSTGTRDEPVTINGNIIYNLENTAIAAAAVTGINTVHYGNNNAFQLSKNRIYDLRTPAATTGIVSGLLINGYKGAGTYNIQNNMISLVAANTEVYGINLFQNMTAVSLYFNSVFIGGTANGINSSAALRKRSSPAAMLSVNNIYYNVRSGGSGKHYALINDRNPPANGWVLSDYNDLYTSNPATVALWYRSSLSFTALQDSSHMDVHSVYAPVQFKSITDLHLLTPLAAGKPLAFITDDFDGDQRNIIPAIGADELLVSSAFRVADKIAATVLLYPNPAHDYIIVNLSGHISIYDAMGRRVKEQVSNTTKTVINIQDLTPGVYMITVGTVTKQFIKN
jgi:hypothetical protein